MFIAIKNHKFHITSFLLLIGELLDGITTFTGIRLGLIELNPIPYKIGWGGMILLKIFIPLMCVFMMEFVMPKAKVFTLIKWGTVSLCWLPVFVNIFWIIISLLCFNKF